MAASGMIKSGFVSIIGLPNAGKSTFLNAAINDKIAITSKKPQTTRKNLKGIYNDSESQIVFVDTPGIHDVKNKLDEFMSKSIKKSIEDIDLIIVIVDALTYKTDNYEKLNKILLNRNITSFLLINKCDKCETEKNELISEVLDKFDSKIKFSETIFISALKNDNINDCLTLIKNYLPTGERYYNEDDLTDEPLKEIVADMIRQQCLYKLDKEIPHGIAVIVDKMRSRPDGSLVDIEATIICERESHKGIIIGKNGAMLKKIGTQSRHDIEDMLQQRVNLKLWVKVRPGWRDKKLYMEEYGYKK